MLKRDQKLTQSALAERLAYDPVSGVFSHRTRLGSTFIGQTAGRVNKNGYRYISLWKKMMLAHRLAWLYMTGALPEFEIDHRDGNRDNNAWLNLRAATHAQNQQNKGSAWRNKNGFAGVHVSRSGIYRARVKIGGKSKWFGPYRTAEEAHARYLLEKLRRHSHVDRILNDTGPQGVKREHAVKS